MLSLYVVFGWLIAVAAIGADDNIDKLELLIKNQQIAELSRYLGSLSSEEKRHPVALFAQGITSNSARDAIRYYNQIAQNHHTSEFADQAIYRIAQYQYLKKNYRSAKNYFSLLSRHYGKSSLKDDSQYMYCQSLIAEGALDSARLFLKTFIKNVPRSPYVDVAIQDLEEIKSLQVSKSVAAEPFRYSIQVGAFSQRANAQKFVDTLKRKNIPADIVMKKVGRKILWAVWIGKFSTRDLAKSYAERYLVNLLGEYQIVDSKG